MSRRDYTRESTSLGAGQGHCSHLCYRSHQGLYFMQTLPGIIFESSPKRRTGLILERSPSPSMALLGQIQAYGSSAFSFPAFCIFERGILAEVLLLDLFLVPPVPPASSRQRRRQLELSTSGRVSQALISGSDRRHAAIFWRSDV